MSRGILINNAFGFAFFVLWVAYRFAFSTGRRDGIIVIARVPLDLGLGLLCGIGAIGCMYVRLPNTIPVVALAAIALGSLTHYSTAMGRHVGVAARLRERRFKDACAVAGALYAFEWPDLDATNACAAFVKNEATAEELARIADLLIGVGWRAPRQELADRVITLRNENGARIIRKATGKS